MVADAHTSMFTQVNSPASQSLATVRLSALFVSVCIFDFCSACDTAFELHTAIRWNCGLDQMPRCLTKIRLHLPLHQQAAPWAWLLVMAAMHVQSDDVSTVC